MRILVLAVPIGAGHIKAAAAIAKAVEEIDKKVQIRTEDCFQWVWHPYGYAYKKIYDFGQLHSHHLLKALYGGAGVKSGSSNLLYWFHKKTAGRFRRLLAEYRPNYILCAHFSPSYYAAIYKKEFGCKIGVVVTDYYVHPHWINKDIDHYFIPHESLIESMMGFGAYMEKIYPLGLPVNPVFDAGIDKSASRKRFSIVPGRISAAVMGSRIFGGEWYEIVREIVDFDYDLYVLCGDNKLVMDRINDLKGKASLTTLGMVDKVHELMAVCDILITKAGGITSTEATKVGPCLLFANSIPGLEDKNENFFIQHGAAVKITRNNARRIIGDLITHQDKMVQMKRNLSRLNKSNSALNIARVILCENGKKSL